MATESDDKTTAPVEDGDERTRDRSPPFPFISLEKAIERARILEAEYKRSAGRVSNVLSVWGYTAKSSGGAQTIGALKAFGLIEDEGSGADRKVKLTDLALRILKDERPGKRLEAIQEAALKPKAFQQFWGHWHHGRPPDRECQSELTLDRGFTEDAAKRFIQVYDETMRFSEMETAGKVSDKLLDELLTTVKVGDYVQWEPGGILQFPEPRRVVEISQKRDFAFVEGSQTGLPIGEVKVVPDPTTPMHTAVGDIRSQDSAIGGTGTVRPAVRQDIFNLDEGPVVLQYPAKMTADSYEDFEGWINLQLKKIKRGISQ